MERIDVAVIGGGQSGLAAARALRHRTLAPVIFEAAGEPTGAWPRYYDSLRLFSPARYSGLPGLPFGGDPARYPHRDEVVDYLRRHAAGLDVEVRPRQRVEAAKADTDPAGFAAQRLADQITTHLRRGTR
ncbi:NAD(P)-binding domain-containing protein [Frankia sp. CNm7]|uniref:NAD(P)-binding domain-containing protein n=1 Tax=Frankia nepalensis TaxID=1836974 RepID=A0A937RDK9_9ACTN|nr:NAD(P)-binding domain-containing protein [Frankia nepalensis]MBL7499471.1 NAD(P)-binding domain-containing protein [Frankia nepalensis]MBL7513735.1 NAD(P)-binding domain-containing protein [Frankia nepalensis]MBL7522878.1 NAD(P)-binding domain-containing protein [Frankia nepalensis]MBL7628297.1 NAD(P)-binding domain-containing protein [Frankia nepalensis]